MIAPAQITGLLRAHAESYDVPVFKQRLLRFVEEKLRRGAAQASAFSYQPSAVSSPPHPGAGGGLST